MSATNELPPQPEPAQPDGPPPLRRRPEERMVAGVAAAIARRFTVDPLLVRITFALLVLAGGFGLLAYLAGWLLIPLEGGDPAQGRSKLVVWTGIALAVLAAGALLGPSVWLALPLVVLALVVVAIGRSRGEGDAGDLPSVLIRIGLALALLIGTAVATVGAGLLTAAGGGVAMAVLVIVLAVAAAIMAVSGRRSGRWLLVPAVSVALVTGLVLATGLTGIGERVTSPASASEIMAADNELAIGDLKVDLGRARLEPGTVTPLRARVGIGRLRVVLPRGACVTGTVRVRAGEVSAASLDREGVGLTLDLPRPGPGVSAPVIAVDLTVGAGQLTVERAGGFIYADAPRRDRLIELCGVVPR